MAARLIHVVRHAHAGDPNAWTRDDDLRPLSDRGCGEAERLVRSLDGPAPAVVYASPSVRCIATVVPLARAHGLPVSTLSELYEGGTGAVLLARLLHEPSPVVVCTHGDVIEDLLALLAQTGVALTRRNAEKGSTWTLELSGGQVSAARYSPPP